MTDPTDPRDLRPDMAQIEPDPKPAPPRMGAGTLALLGLLALAMTAAAKLVLAP